MKERLFKLRMAQLDLARQMETVEYVQNFIDFISRYDYNAFFLYIEWRIRTDTFDIGEKSGPPAEPVVCTSPIRAYYRQGPSKGL